MATTWYTWCENATSTSTSSTWYHWCGTNTITNDSTVWSTWATTAPITSTTTDCGVWNSWVSSNGTTTYSNVVVMPAREPTPEERVESARRQEEYTRRQEEERKRQAIADAKAMELLRANISQRQREALDKHGWFLVEGGKSKKQYRLHKNGRMEEMEGDAAVASFCVHADYNIPMPDQVLAKALCIKLDEEWILKTANKTPLRRAA